MTLYNFNRAYELIIGKPPYETLAPILPDANPLASAEDPFRTTRFDLSGSESSLDNRTTIEKDALKFSTKDKLNPLQIQASINQNSISKGSDNNTATIKIFNLSESSRNKISRKNNKVILKAGYKDQEDNGNLPIIFTGQVLRSSTEKVGPDIVTTLVCDDGYTPSNAIRISRTIKGDGKTYEDVFLDLLNIWADNGVQFTEDSVKLVTNVILSPSELSVGYGWSYTGYLRDAMDDVCEHFDYTWYIINNVIYIHPDTYNNFTLNTKLSLTQIKSLKDQQDATNDNSTDKEKSGVELITFLNGGIKVGSKVEITEGNRAGRYSIRAVSHSLDFRGQDWDTKVVAER